jgi:hypothetical protein
MRTTSTISPQPVQRTASSAFFSGSPLRSSNRIQPKLTVNAPNDVYEKEADQVADAVMRKPAVAEVAPSNVVTTMAASITPVQRKCAACGEGEQLQREENEGERLPAATSPLHDYPGERKPPALQRFAIDCSAFSKKEEELDAEDAAASGVALPASTAGEEEEEGEEVQRKCAGCEKEEEKRLQRQGQSEIDSASPSFESALNASKASGSPLPGGTRSFMENRFGADFSGVRVHADSSSASMNRSINAHAFTHGQDVYFDSGQYRPHTDSGQKLLAHELTHVAQQGGASVQRKKPQGASSALPDIQRQFYFANRPKTSGTRIHRAVLPLFLAANPNLFIEVAIPGANKKDIDKGKTGVADFYRAGTTIALKFDGQPGFLNRDTDLEVGTGIVPGNYSHERDAAPVGTTLSPRIRKLNVAPYVIQIGDLKPGGSGETVLGQGQVANYIAGIETTRDDLNSYLQNRPEQSDSATKKWAASPTPMKSLTIPNDLRYTVGGGIRGLQNRPLALYREGKKRPYLLLDMTGTLYVYKDRRDGVWSYEWIPDNVPATTGSPEVNQVLARLNNDIIPALTQSQGTSIAPKRAPAGRSTLFRKPQQFSDEEWKKKHYNQWKKDATKVLANKTEVKKAEVATGILDIEKRSGEKVKAPEEVKEAGRGLPKVRHWKRFGGFYGWLREKFDFVYVKIKGVVDKVKTKVRNLAKKAGDSSFGSWIKAVAKVVFKIFKMVGSWVVTQVMDKLLNSLRQGIMNNLSKLIEKALPDDAKKYLEKFCALKAEYDGIIGKTEDDIITAIFGDKLTFFETAEKIESAIGYVADIATLIEWGVRILACASPPAIGCLWNLAIEALKWIFAKLIQTCWFTKEVYAPIINKVNFVKEFPSKLAGALVDELNKYLPVPDGLNKWFAPVNVNMNEYKVNCNEGSDGSAGLTADRKAIFDLAKDEVARTGSDQKLKAALQLMLKRGAGPWVLLTKERAEQLKAALATADQKEMTDAAADKTKPVPDAMQGLVGDIGSYTEAEKKLIGDFKAKQAAREATKKQILDILNDPKAKEALAKPYPSNDQLRKDLETLPWDSIDKGTGDFVSVGGRTIFAIRTDTDARTGCYFKYFEKEYQGTVKKMVIDVSNFYAVDDIPKDANATFSVGSLGILFMYFVAQPKGTLTRGPLSTVFGALVDITPL